MDNGIFMVIMFPDNGEETIKKMQAVMQFISEYGGIICDMDEDGEAADIDGIDPANIRFRFAGDEDENTLPI